MDRFLIDVTAGSRLSGVNSKYDFIAIEPVEAMSHEKFATEVGRLESDLRADTDIPTAPGFCFAGGFIANPRWRNEEASLDVDIAGHPDALVSVWINPLASNKHDKPCSNEWAA
jgi:hypothetical protein